MSYDIRIGVKVEGLDIIAVIDEPEYSSPTYNVGKIFRKCMGWDFKQGEWYNVKDVMPKIQHGISELRMNPKKYKHLEPDNGWGDVGTALEALESLSKCIAENTGESYWGKWQEIPAEYLWLRW
jgi:hypothetical protein